MKFKNMGVRQKTVKKNDLKYYGENDYNRPIEKKQQQKCNIFTFEIKYVTMLKRFIK